MLSAQHRFHGHGSLRYVFKNGDVVRGRLCTIKATRNKRRATSRVAVVVSKKIAKHAVDRNRIRRRVYETIRNELPLVEQPYDVVCIITSPEVRLVKNDILHQTVSSSLRSLGVTKPREK